MRNSWVVVTVLVACGGAPPPPPQPPQDYQARTAAKHRKLVDQLQKACDGGNVLACGNLGVQYVVPYTQRYDHADYTDTSFKLDPDKGLPMVQKGCEAVLASAKTDHNVDEGYMCRVLVEHGTLDAKQAEQIANELCTHDQSYCDLAETASRKAGDEDLAVSAHKVYVGWYCLYWSDRTSEYSSDEKIDKLQAMCDEAKKGGDASSDACHKDTECKGDRICDHGSCKAPK